MKPANVTLAQSLRGYAPVWAVLGLGLAVSALAASWLREEARRTDAARFAGLVEQTRQDFDNITEKYQQALQRLVDAIGVREDFTKAHWDMQVFSLNPEVDFPGLVEIQLVQVSLSTNLPSEWWDVTADDYRSADRERRTLYGHAARFVRSTPLALAPLWSYISPEATKPSGQGLRGDAFLGNDLKAIKGAVGGFAMRMTQPRVVLRQRKSDREFIGTTLIQPVPGESLARGWSTNIGRFRRPPPAAAYDSVLGFTGWRFTPAILCSSFDWQQLLQSQSRIRRPELHLDLYAARKPHATNWLGGSTTAPVTAAEVARASFATNYVIPMYSKRWTIALHTTPHFDRQSTRYRAYVALVGGAVVTLLMAGLLGVQIRARVKQQAIAEELQKSLLDLEAARTEREELGRDLHDGAIQSLYALQLGLSRTATQARENAPAIAERLADYRRSVSGIIGELRRFILSHEADTKSGADLCRVLMAILSRVKPTTSAELNAELDTAAAARLNNEQAVHLANIAREAMSNCLRHGSPTHIKVALGSENGTVQLEIHDDGCGFDPAGLPSGGMGLANMSIRAREAGGELKVETAHGRGTRVVVRVTECESTASELVVGGSALARPEPPEGGTPNPLPREDA